MGKYSKEKTRLRQQVDTTGETRRGIKQMQMIRCRYIEHADLNQHADNYNYPKDGAQPMTVGSLTSKLHSVHISFFCVAMIYGHCNLKKLL